MRKLNWCITKDQSEYMRARKQENLLRCKSNPNENWMWSQLKATGLHWKRQAQWGYRLFDFWCGVKGIAVEVDGREHDPVYDAYRDEYNFRRSALVVLRVRNHNQADADAALAFISQASEWLERKAVLAIDGSNGLKRNWLAKMPYPPCYLKQYLANPTAAPQA